MPTLHLAVQPGERALLAHLLARLQDLDPDVLVGHNIAAFDLDVLLHRLQHHKARSARSQHACWCSCLAPLRACGPAEAA